MGASRQRRRSGSYPAAAGHAMERCAPSSPGVAVPTILHELRFLGQVPCAAVAEMVTEAPCSSAVTAEEISDGSAAVDAKSSWMAMQPSPSLAHSYPTR